MRKISRYVVENWNQCNFGLFLPKFGCHGTALAPLKIQMAYLNSATPKGCYSREKCLDMLYRTEISAILAYFCPKLVAMATSLAPLKIQIAYLNSATPKGCYSRETFVDMLYRTEISANLAYFCPNLVAMASALAPLKMETAYLNSATPKGCYLREKCLDMLYRTEISAILAYFCPHLVAMATSLAPLKIQIACLNSLTPKTLPNMQEVSRYLVQSWN